MHFRDTMLLFSSVHLKLIELRKREKEKQDCNILQAFGDNVGVRTINLIIIAYRDARKGHCPYRTRRIDGRHYGIVGIMIP